VQESLSLIGRNLFLGHEWTGIPANSADFGGWENGAAMAILPRM
jgi:hypothetical protein